jgi:hypothetical protein
LEYFLGIAAEETPVLAGVERSPKHARFAEKKSAAGSGVVTRAMAPRLPGAQAISKFCRDLRPVGLDKNVILVNLSFAYP